MIEIQDDGEGQRIDEIAERMFRGARASVDWHYGEPLRGIANAYATQLGADAALNAAVTRAREHGCSWPAIAAILGITAETARARYETPPPVESV